MSTINQYIDHTLLKPTATDTDISILCQEAITHKFYAVCVNGCYVSLARKLLKETDVKIATVIGFPLGAMATASKVFEAEQAIKDGANEVDMVLNIGALISENYAYIEDEIRLIKKAIGAHILKVIIETCYLTKSQIEKATQLVINANADFVKTSTGFGSRGANFEDMRTMHNITKDTIQIKISGGIRDLKTAQTYIAMGASRLGTSSGIKLITNTNTSHNSY